MKKITEGAILSSKPIKRLKHSLTYGNLWLYILSLINEKGKMYAYKLDEEIEKGFLFKPNKIMVYVVLYKLERENIIKAKKIKMRKYYTLTQKGKAILRLGKEYMKMLGERL